MNNINNNSDKHKIIPLPTQPLKKRDKKQERAHLYQLATGIFFRIIKANQVEIQLVFAQKDLMDVKRAAIIMESHKSVNSLTFATLIGKTASDFAPVLIATCKEKIKIQLESWLKENPNPRRRLTAALVNNQLMVQYRLKRELAINEVKNTTSTKQPSEDIYNAAQFNQGDTLKKLIAKGENPFFQDKFDQTALHLAVQGGYAECAKILLNAQPALANFVDQTGETALHVAAAGGFLAILELLQNSGGDIHGANKFGATPLHRAASFGHTDIALWLIGQGVNIGGKDNMKQTAAQCAQTHGHFALATKLTELQKQNESITWFSNEEKEILQKEIFNQMKLHDTEAELSTHIEIKSGDNTFLILTTVTREEAEALFQQERIRILFKEGEKVANASFGQGHFGQVGPAKYINSKGQVFYVGVKKVNDNKVHNSEQEDRHHYYLNGLPHIIPFFGSVMTPSARYQFMALGGLGNGQTLSMMISQLLALKLLNEKETECLWIYVAQSLLTGLAGMHQKNAYHLDMKPANLVINGWGEVYLIDFGCMAKLNSGQSTKESTQKLGDVRYFSLSRFLLSHAAKHKQIQSFSFDLAKEDVWMAGLTLLEMIKNFTQSYNPDGCWMDDNELKNALNSMDNPQAFFEKKLTTISALQSPAKGSLWELIKQMLTLDENKRPNVAGCLKHPVFDNKALMFKSKQAREELFAQMQDQYEEYQQPKKIVFTPTIQLQEKQPVDPGKEELFAQTQGQYEEYPQLKIDSTPTIQLQEKQPVDPGKSEPLPNINFYITNPEESSAVMNNNNIEKNSFKVVSKTKYGIEQPLTKMVFGQHRVDSNNNNSKMTQNSIKEQKNQ